MALFRGIQEYIALDANNITLVFDSGNIVSISCNIFLYPPQGHPILYNHSLTCYLKLTKIVVSESRYMLNGMILILILRFSRFYVVTFLNDHLMGFIYLNVFVMLVPKHYMMTSYQEVVV